MRSRIAAVVVLASLCAAVAFVPVAGAETVARWEPPAQGAAEMFARGGRVFAVGAQSGGAGVAVPADGTANLQPSPGGTPIPNSRCAMVVGQCAGGSCIYHLSFYCKTDDCSGRKFC